MFGRYLTIMVMGHNLYVTRPLLCVPGGKFKWWMLLRSDFILGTKYTLRFFMAVKWIAWLKLWNVIHPIKVEKVKKKDIIWFSFEGSFVMQFFFSPVSMYNPFHAFWFIALYFCSACIRSDTKYSFHLIIYKWSVCTLIKSFDAY